VLDGLCVVSLVGHGGGECQKHRSRYEPLRRWALTWIVSIVATIPALLMMVHNDVVGGGCPRLVMQSLALVTRVGNAYVLNTEVLTTPFFLTAVQVGGR
jgi:hypothetical protein